MDVSGFCERRIVHATRDCFHLEAHFSLLVNMRNHFHLDNVEMFCTCHFKPKPTLLHDAFCCNVFTLSFLPVSTLRILNKHAFETVHLCTSDPGINNSYKVTPGNFFKDCYTYKSTTFI